MERLLNFGSTLFERNGHEQNFGSGWSNSKNCKRSKDSEKSHDIH